MTVRHNYRDFRARICRALLITLCLAGCTGDAPPSSIEEPATRPALRVNRLLGQLVVGVDDDLAGFGGLLFGDPSASGPQTIELFHAFLTTVDNRGLVVPRLAAAAPSLDDGSWRTNPDGTMETVYRLRSDLRWHDGAPFTAQDLVFSHESRLAESMGPRADAVSLAIRTVRALDPLRLEVAWSSPHWRAGRLREELTPLPAHLLGPAAARGEVGDLPYWTTGFIGLGPYRVLDFAPGRVELGAFDGYVHGRPAIEHLTLRGYHDAGSLQAAVVQDEVDVALAAGWGAPTAIELRVAWELRGSGSVLVFPRATTFAVFRRDDRASPSSLQHPPLRRALASALNRQQTGFTDSLGLLPPPTSWIPSSDPRWEAAGAGVQDVYPYDAARSFRLLEDAGWRRDPEGHQRSPAGEPLTFELTSLESDAMQLTVARYWSEIGAMLNLTQSPPSTRALPGNWSGVLLRPVPSGLDEAMSLLDSHLPGASRPVAAGRSDDVALRLRTALRSEERSALERELVAAVAEEQPIIPLGFRPSVVPVARGVNGLRPRAGADLRPWITFNAHEWHIVE